MFILEVALSIPLPKAVVRPCVQYPWDRECCDQLHLEVGAQNHLALGEKLVYFCEHHNLTICL